MNDIHDLDRRMADYYGAEAPSRAPDWLLTQTLETINTTPQRWSGLRAARLGLPGLGLGRPMFALGGAVAAVVVAVAALALNLDNNQPAVGGPATGAHLPTTPDAWSRVVIDARTEGGVDVVVAGPRGLLAVVGEVDESTLYFSADGRDWTRVPTDQYPSVGANGAALVATDQGFLMVGSEVLASEDGLTWRRIAGPTEDRDLRSGTPIAAAAAGPGLVAVGADNKAWYSTDGSDWALAEVPPPPGEPSPLERPLDRTQTQGTVEMQGVAVSGRNLVAWGISIWVHDDNSATFVPVVWASNDGVSWAKVDAPQWAYPKVASGPNGFAVASEEGSVWLSADGRSWERAAKDAFGSSRWPELLNDDGIRVEMQVSSLAAGVAGYIAVGTDGVCMLGCSSEETVIWTSPDGRTWSRLPDDDLFRAVAGAGADVAAARGFDFIVGGESDGKPTIWISGSEQAGNGAAASTAPAPPILTPTPGQPVDYAGTWEATDPPPDSSHLTMEVIVMADGSHEVTIRDDSASVCAGAPSTMTGVAEKGEPGMIVIAQPDFRCDDGSVAQAHSGPPLDEQLRNLGFSYDSLRDALRDSLGLEWIRAEAAP